MAAVRPIGEAEAEARARGICFKNGPPRRIGVELEWLVHDSLDPLRPVAPARLTAAFADLRRLSLHCTLTQEPGGQLELSSQPANSLTECVESVASDLLQVRERLRGHRLRLAGYGHEPWHRPHRLLWLPRYTAMEEYFDRSGPAGRSMMCSTASVQVCLDAGTDGPGCEGYPYRWRLAHLLGPVLIAMFANSPLSEGRPTGVRSTRQVVWNALDPARTQPPGDRADPRDAWAAYALDAPVLCIQQEGSRWAVPHELTFREWVRGRGRGRVSRAPTAEDLSYHLTTLFPPVRPQGYLELRMVDAQPGDDGWIVPLAVAAALLDDPVAAAAAYRATSTLAGSSHASAATEDVAGPSRDVLRRSTVRGRAGQAGTPRGPSARDRWEAARHSGTPPYEQAPGNPLWRRAARRGLSDPDLRRAAEECFTAARDALPRLGASAAVLAVVDAFADRYLARGRCPADDLLETAERGRSAVPRTATLTGKDSLS